jgi:hypothetical protein
LPPAAAPPRRAAPDRGIKAWREGDPPRPPPSESKLAYLQDQVTAWVNRMRLANNPEVLRRAAEKLAQRDETENASASIMPLPKRLSHCCEGGQLPHPRSGPEDALVRRHVCETRPISGALAEQLAAVRQRHAKGRTIKDPTMSKKRKKWKFKLNPKLYEEVRREIAAEAKAEKAAEETLRVAKTLEKLMAPARELTRDQLLVLIARQAVFTDDLRRVSNAALAHANHLVSNYASDIPKDKMKDWAKAQVDASALLLHPAPVTPPLSN